MKNFLLKLKQFRQCSIVDKDFPQLREIVDADIKWLLDKLPKIVCLCGSTKFKEAFNEANRSETLNGNLVISVGLFGHDENANGGSLDFGSDENPSMLKLMLDELHLRKIDLADEILVINVGGYIGKSTNKEIQYAMMTGKEVRYLEAK